VATSSLPTHPVRRACRLLAVLVGLGAPAGCGAPGPVDADAVVGESEAAVVTSEPADTGPTSRPDEPELALQPDEPELVDTANVAGQPGVEEIVIDQVVDGVVVERRALIAVPQTDGGNGDEDDTDTTVPVLVVLHGNGGQPEGMLRALQPVIDQNRFITLIPEGLERSWNLGREASTADDVAFVERLLDRIAGVPSDTDKPTLGRIYAFGYSNGAGLVHQLIARTDRFHAVAAAASGLTNDLVPPGSVAPVSVLSLHGTEDQLVPYDGGIGVAGHDFLPVEDSVAVWADRFGCETEPDLTRTADGNIRLEWGTCDDGHRVVHYGIEGAGHGLPPDLEGGLLDLVIDFFETAGRLGG